MFDEIEQDAGKAAVENPQSMSRAGRTSGWPRSTMSFQRRPPQVLLAIVPRFCHRVPHADDPQSNRTNH